jgi:hypothetical protein
VERILFKERQTHCRREYREEAMLGEVIGEANGTVTSIEVVSVEQGSSKLKVSLRGSGKAMGVAFTDLITYTRVEKVEGIILGDGEAVWLTEDGEVCTWKGFGIGKPSGVGGAETDAVCGWFQTKSAKLAILNTIATIVEYDLDDNGNYHWTAYEWKHPSW